MGLFGQQADPGPWTGWERKPEAPDLATFTAQQWKDQTEVANLDAQVVSYHDAFNRINDHIKGATGEVLDNPMSAGQGPLASFDAATTFSRQGFNEFGPIKAWNARVAELRQKHPDALDWDWASNEPHREVWDKLKSTRERTNELNQAAGLIESTDVPIVGGIPYVGPLVGAIPALFYNMVRHPQYTSAQLAAGFAAQNTSPLDATVNLLSFGSGGAGVSIIKNALLNAGVNAVGQGILSAPKQLTYRDAGLPWGIETWLSEVAGAAAGGFAIDAAIRGPARSILRRYGRDVAPGEMFSKNTERAGWLTDLPEDLALPKAPPVREAISQDLIERARNDEPAALRELAEKTGAIEDPAVKGALDHIELGGAVDEAMSKFFKDAGIDHGEGIKTLSDVMQGRYDYVRAPEPVPQAKEPLLRNEARDFIMQHAGDLETLMQRAIPQLNGIDPRLAQYIDTAVENGFADVLPIVRKAVDALNEGRAENKVLKAFIKEIVAHADENGLDRLAALDTLHSGRASPVQVAHVMRMFPDLVDTNLRLDNAFMRGARSLAALDDDAFGMVGELPPGVAAAVSDLVPPGQHAKVMGDLRKGDIGTTEEARAAIPLLIQRERMPAHQGGIDDIAGPEAKAQTERLAEEHADAIKEAEAPLKERDKIQSRIEELKGEIAKLEEKAKDAGGKMFALSERDQGYVDRAMSNLRATSRTAQGVVDTSASAGKAAQMAEGLTGDAAKSSALANFEKVFTGIVETAGTFPRGGEAVGKEIDRIAIDVNKGILKEGALYRTDDSPKYPYTAANELEAAHKQFSEELDRRLQDPTADPVETAAWIEWRANLTDHFWADGVGKTSKALAAIPLIRAGMPLPEYRSNKEFFAHASKKRYSPAEGPDSYLDASWKKFLDYYRTLMPAIEDTTKYPGFGTTPFERLRRFNIEGRTVVGYPEAFRYLRSKFEEAAGPDGPAIERKATIVIGPPGAGKSTLIDQLAKLSRSVVISADDPKFMLPEFERGAAVVHEEASAIAKRIQFDVLDDGQNVIIEKLGHSAGSIERLVADVKTAGYDVRVAFVTAPRDQLITRIAERAKKTGRDVPIEILDQTLSGIDNTLKMLANNEAIGGILSVDTGREPPHISGATRLFGGDLEKALTASRLPAPETSGGEPTLVPGSGGRGRGEGQPGLAQETGGAGGEGRQAPGQVGKALYAFSDSDISKIANLREELHAANQALAEKQAEISGERMTLADHIMASAAVQRAIDVRRAFAEALAFGDRILPEGVKIDVEADLRDPTTGAMLDAQSDMATGAITLATYATNPGARLGHEGVHTLVTLGHLSPEEVGLLARAARESGVDFKEAKYREAYKDRADLDRLIEEEAAAHYVEAKIKSPDPAVQSIRDRIEALIERIRNALNGLGFKTAEDVRDAILRGDVARREAVQAWMRQEDLSAVAVRHGTGNVMAALSDRETGQSMRRDLDALGFYSQALEAARNLKQAKGTPEQMLAQLKSAGVKQAEIDATNLQSLFEGKKSVTRDEIVKHLEQNRVGLKEVVRSTNLAIDDQPAVREVRDIIGRRRWEAHEPSTGLWNRFQTREAAEDARRTAAVGNLIEGAHEPKWSAHSLDPSNPTYRETVLHLPGTDTPEARAAIESDFAAGRISEDEMRRRWDDMINEPGSFTAGHFPEPNIVGHMMTSMVKHDGRPVYLIDQIQSDWGQKLRDGGVRDEAKIAELEKQVAEMSDLSVLKTMTDEQRQQRWTDYNRIKAELETAKATTPGHPLVNTTDQWTNTTLRRAITQAVEALANERPDKNGVIGYIAIPSGKTVEGYNPQGDSAGNAYFYEQIVPKNLRNILSKLDKASHDPKRVETLTTPTKGEAGKGFTLFPLTDTVKQKVRGEGQQMFAFAGERARTADLDALANAKQMEADGAKREYVWSATGWFRGVDGKWRFEIDDSGAKLAGYAVPTLTTPNVGSWFGQAEELVSHDRLFAAYPDMRNKSIVVERAAGRYGARGADDRGGSYDPASGRIDVQAYGPGTGRSIALHEMQHGVQSREGFADGDGLAGGMDAYWRNAGEVEARAVEKRRNMTPDQRRSRAPWLDYDVPEDQQIVRFGGSGPQMSFGGRLAKTADHAALAKAEQLDAAGTPREQIWQDTGWFKGVDGKWRFEIDDSGASLPYNQIGKEYEGPIRSLLDHPELNAAYPDVGAGKGVLTLDPNAAGATGMAYRNGTVTVKSPTLPDARTTFLHETQHQVQKNEGFNSGAGYSLLNSPESWNAYLKNSGEAEARLVEKRADLTPDQRRARAPWLDYDVPEDQQIVRFANGTSLSMFAFSEEPPVEGPAMRGLKMFAIRAYHGSPHDFDKFSLDKIGTGEGAQAYGHGLYFAEAEDVAKSYKTAGPAAAKLYDGINTRLRDLAREMSKLERPGQYRQYKDPRGYELAAEYDRLLEQKTRDKVGRMYEVRINADPEHFLDWDKPITNQPKAVEAAAWKKLESALDQPGPVMHDVYDKFESGKATGEDVVRLFGDKQTATQTLRDAGIPGIKYLDQGSRTAGGGSRNFVVFDDSIIEIVAKDGKPVDAAERQQIVDGMTGQDKAAGKMFALRDMAERSDATLIDDVKPGMVPSRVLALHGTTSPWSGRSFDISRTNSHDTPGIFFGTRSDANYFASSAYAGSNGGSVRPSVIDTTGFQTHDWADLVRKVGTANAKDPNLFHGNTMEALMRAETERKSPGFIVTNVRTDNGRDIGAYVVVLPDGSGRVQSATSGEKMFALNDNPEPRPPLHAEMAAIDRMNSIRELALACRG